MEPWEPSPSEGHSIVHPSKLSAPKAIQPQRDRKKMDYGLFFSNYHLKPVPVLWHCVNCFTEVKLLYSQHTGKLQAFKTHMNYSVKNFNQSHNGCTVTQWLSQLPHHSHMCIFLLVVCYLCRFSLGVLVIPECYILVVCCLSFPRTLSNKMNNLINS